MPEKEITIELKNPELIVLVIILSAIFVLELQVTFNSPIVFGDEGIHARIAQLMSKNVEYPVWLPYRYTKLSRTGFSRPPLLHILISSFLFVFGNSEAIINFLIPFMSFLTGLSVFFLGKELYNKNVGFIASIIVVTIPAFATYSVLIYTDVLVTLLLTLFFLFFILGIKREKDVYFIVSGVFAALAFLTKTSGFASYILIFLAFLYQIILKRKYGLIKKYFILIFISVLILGPFLLRNFYYFKTPTCDFPYISDFLDVSGCEIDEFEGKYKYTERTEQVGTEQSVYRMGITNYLNFAYGGNLPILFNISIVVLAAISGLFLVLSKRKESDIFLLLMLFIFLLVFYTRSNTRAEDTARYTLGWVPFIALLAANWFDKVYEFIKKYQKYIALIVFIFVIFISYQNLKDKLNVMESVKQFSPAFFEASDWIKENLPEDATLSTVWVARAFYTTQRNTVHSASIHLSRDVNYTKEVAEKMGITHIFIQKFSLSDKVLSEKYSIEEVQFFEDNPETFKKVYENGPPLEQCLQQGGCDGNIIYEIVY